VLQLVDAGKLSLDDDISRFIPEFPMQGHRVTVRQLLDHTSGIVDYHYLGDPIEATSRQPKGLDEVMALYAGRPWMNAPGTKWDWSISGFQLLVTTVERVSGERFADYVQRHILAPAKTTSTSYCDDFTLVRGLSHAYRMAGDAPVPAQENDMAYNADLRFCSTVSDLYRMWRAVTEVPLIKAETFARMTTATGAAARLDPKDSASRYGLAIRLNHEEGHRNIGQHGSLFGYSGSLYDFPDDQLTVVVLTNTEGQNAYAIGRALARTMLGLAQLPPRAASPPRTLADQPVTPSERQQLAGTYQLKLEQVTADLHDSYAVYRRTYRVFDENGWLMIQPLGYAPERLLKQEDGSFAIRSSPSRHITFTIAKGQATTLTMDPSPFGVTMSGKRVGKGDPVTFHRQLQ
jgi:CubicO group peptidase (beta-lactamase class C family)